jgi:hypothetical protein
MSRSMHWRPVPPPPVDNQLDTDLMFHLEKHLFHDHWEYNSGYEITTNDTSLISFLQGLAACGVEGAQELIKLVFEHKKIVIWAGDEDGPR